MVALFGQFNPTQALQGILKISANTITTRTSALPEYLLLEAMAQSCGLHLRWKEAFRIAAYLASCTELALPDHPESMPQEITASLVSQTASAASYTITVAPLGMHGRILIGYAQSAYQEHFARRFQCLLSTTA